MLELFSPILVKYTHTQAFDNDTNDNRKQPGTLSVRYWCDHIENAAVNQKDSCVLFINLVLW